MVLVKLIVQLKGGRDQGPALRMAKLKALAQLEEETVMVGTMVQRVQCRRG